MADELREWKPRNRLANALAGGLKSVNAFAAKPFGYDNPPGEMLVNALALPQIANTLERYSYGQPLTNAGKANVPYLPSDTADALMAVAPAVAKWPKQAAGAALGLMGAADTGGANMAGIKLIKGQMGDFLPVKHVVTGDWKEPSKFVVGREGEVTFYSPSDIAKGKDGTTRNMLDSALDEVFSHKYPEDEFFRFTNNQKELAIAKAGQLRNSRNFRENINEPGLSVSSNPSYASWGYNSGYRVKGRVIGTGSDGEPLLDPATIQVLDKKLMSSKEISDRHRALKDAALQRAFKDNGWTLEQYNAARNNGLNSIPIEGQLFNWKTVKVERD